MIDLSKKLVKRYHKNGQYKSADYDRLMGVFNAAVYEVHKAMIEEVLNQYPGHRWQYERVPVTERFDYLWEAGLWPLFEAAEQRFHNTRH